MKKYTNEVYTNSLNLMSPSSKKKLMRYSILNLLLSFLDLIGVVLIGVVGGLALNGVRSINPQGKLQQTLEILRLNHFSFQTQVAFLGLISAFFLLSRTLLSMIVTRSALYFLAEESFKVSVGLISKILNKSAYFVRNKSGQEVLYAVTTGIDAITMKVLGTSVLLLSDLSLLIVLSIGLIIINIKMALLMFSIFAIISYTTFKMFNKKAVAIGANNGKLNIKLNSKILEVLTFYREAYIRSTRENYLSEISIIRKDLSKSNAQIDLMPNTSKYIMEISVVCVGLLITGLQFIFFDATHAITILAIYLAAGARIAPAVLRIQQGLITMKAGSGYAEHTFKLIADLEKEADYLRETEVGINKSPERFAAQIVFEKVEFYYNIDEIKTFKMENLNFEIPEGSSFAIVGPSGAGKTTLIDLILGIVMPTSGHIKISRHHPRETIRKWPGEIAYVPQDIHLINGTIRENITIGFKKETFSDKQIWEVLEISQLASYVRKLPEMLNEKIGENGAKLSGGQKQRLGIARALVTNPHFLILDEATSSLDSETESDVTLALANLKGKITMLTIAHRLSTVKEAEKIIYLSNGKIEAIDNFKGLQSRIPAFENQVRMMGLN